MPAPANFAYVAPDQQNAYGQPGWLGTLDRIRPDQDTDRNMRSIMPGSFDRNRVVPEAILSGPRTDRGA